MRFVICYDITDDRRRARVSAALLDYGARVQESVFVATLDEVLLAKLVERLKRLMDPLADKDPPIPSMRGVRGKGDPVGRR